MVEVITNTMQYFGTSKLEQLKKVKNLSFHYFNSYMLAKQKIVAETLEKNKQMSEIMKNIAAKDTWFGKDYVSPVFGNNPEVIYNLNKAKHFKVKTIALYYTDMRFLTHIISERLFSLTFTCCRLQDSTLECLIGINLPFLESLKLEGNPLTNRSVRIIDMWSIPSIRYINLNATLITEEGINHICLLKTYEKLQYLHIILDETIRIRIDPLILLNLKNIERIVCRRTQLKSLRYVKKSQRFKFLAQTRKTANSIVNDYSSFEPEIVINNNLIY